MVRRNEDLQLEELSKNIEKWYLEEFGEEINKQTFAELLYEMIGKDVSAFCFKRLSHLKGEDLIKFTRIWIGKETTAEPTSKEAQVADSARVAGQSEESPKDVGEGIRHQPNKRGKRHSGNGSLKNN